MEDAYEMFGTDIKCNSQFAEVTLEKVKSRFDRFAVSRPPRRFRYSG